MIMKKIQCPKCQSYDIASKVSCGGPAIYKQLVCQKCNYEGNHSRVYHGEEIRVRNEIMERFVDKDNQPDAVRSTLASYGL